MPGFHDNPIPDSDASRRSAGAMSILVWLIVGGAVLVAVAIIWDARSRSRIQAETAKFEEAVRREVTQSFRLLRNNHPREAIEMDAAIGEKIAWLTRVYPDGYRGLRAMRLFIRSEALTLLGGEDECREAEKGFTTGLALLERSGGETWEMGLYGRGKARYNLGEYGLAGADFDLLVQGNPNFGAAYGWRSLARTALGDADGAAEDETRARVLGVWPPADAP